MHLHHRSIPCPPPSRCVGYCGTYKGEIMLIKVTFYNGECITMTYKEYNFLIKLDKEAILDAETL